MGSTSLRYEAGTKTINDLVNLHENNQLELSPAFQRDSVWQERDRANS